MTIRIGFGPSDMTADTANTGGIIRVERRDSIEPDEGRTYIIIGKLLPGTRRRNFQGRSRYFQRGELNLSSEWELAHLWAPRFGDEAAAGIMWAPRELNQAFQNHRVEPWLTGLRDSAAAGAVQITAVAISWSNRFLAKKCGWSGFKGAEFLKHVCYEVSECPRGMLDPNSGVRLFGASVSMTLEPPRPGIVPKVAHYDTRTLRGV